MRRAATRSNLPAGAGDEMHVSMDLPQERENKPQLYEVTIMHTLWLIRSLRTCDNRSSFLQFHLEPQATWKHLKKPTHLRSLPRNQRITFVPTYCMWLAGFPPIARSPEGTELRQHGAIEHAVESSLGAMPRQANHLVNQQLIWLIWVIHDG